MPVHVQLSRIREQRSLWSVRMESSDRGEDREDWTMEDDNLHTNATHDQSLEHTFSPRPFIP